MNKDFYDFLGRLADNNDRPWFKAHKAEFDSLRSQWIDEFGRLLTICGQWAPEYRWLDPADCVYRIYRDTRFSPDKTPYKTYFSAAITKGGRKSPLAGYYLQTGVAKPGEWSGFNGFYGGLWMPDAPTLRKIRLAIVDNSEEFEEILNEPELKRLYPQWSDLNRALKTAPKGWPKDHPQIEYLRLLDFGREHLVDRKFFLDKHWPEHASDIMRPLKPLIDFLNFTIEEE